MQHTATNTDQQTETQPTIAALIAAHRASVQHAVNLAALKAVAENAESYEGFQRRLANILPADLLAALHITYRWRGDVFSRYDTRPEAVFTFHGEEWTIDNCGHWRIHGPEIYREVQDQRDLPETLLRALVSYEDRQPVTPKPEPEPEPEKGATTLPGDFDSDEIPF